MDKIRSSIMDVLGRAAVTSTKHCDDTVPYRSIDGTCNNIGNPEQGSAGTPLLRVVDNAYDDGKYEWQFLYLFMYTNQAHRSPCSTPKKLFH